MIFVDTNYFVRFLLKDNEQQAEVARELFTLAAKEKVELTTSLVVFFEIIWVLRSIYKKDREVLSRSLFNLLKLNFQFSERDLLIEALGIYQETTLSLEDCYNLVLAKKMKVKDFKTFDNKLKKEFEKNRTIS